jgi:hypothetical protein
LSALVEIELWKGQLEPVEVFDPPLVAAAG